MQFPRVACHNIWKSKQNYSTNCIEVILFLFNQGLEYRKFRNLIAKFCCFHILHPMFLNGSYVLLNNFPISYISRQVFSCLFSHYLFIDSENFTGDLPSTRRVPMMASKLTLVYSLRRKSSPLSIAWSTLCSVVSLASASLLLVPWKRLKVATTKNKPPRRWSNLRRFILPDLHQRRTENRLMNSRIVETNQIRTKTIKEKERATVSSE